MKKTFSNKSAAELLHQMASHDLREPVLSIQLFCQILEKEFPDLRDDAKKYIEFIRESAKRLEGRIGELTQIVNELGSNPYQEGSLHAP